MSCRITIEALKKTTPKEKIMENLIEYVNLSCYSLYLKVKWNIDNFVDINSSQFEFTLKVSVPIVDNLIHLCSIRNENSSKKDIFRKLIQFFSHSWRSFVWPMYELTPAILFAVFGCKSFCFCQSLSLSHLLGSLVCLVFVAVSLLSSHQNLWLRYWHKYVITK